ncbi:STAS domain-containing protein [Lentzea sp. NPDC060358]|uniref:STAS domain-containing protein n=1 Tax=Lentzea sp. NPDC060358 TaxID=3347103 RepID=UPI0036538C99
MLIAQVEDHAGIAVVTVSGEVDMETAQVPLDKAITAVERPLTGLVLDLRAVTFFGSSGINMLVLLHQHVHDRGVPFGVVAHQTVLKPLEVTATDVYLMLFADLPDALAALRAVPRVPRQQRR